MKKEDAEKTMVEIVEAVEKKYPSVKTKIKENEWEKGDYHRLYFNLICIAEVNGKEETEEADFGFINLKTNRYSTRAYNMRHFNVEEFAPAKMLHDYVEAYKTAESDDTLYVAKEGYRYTLDLSKEEQSNGISKKEMLDKSFDFRIPPSAFHKFWTAVGEAPEADEVKEDTPEEEREKIGSYDGHAVTIKLAKNGKYVVEDDGKYTGDYGRDRDGGLYEAAMYLYDRLVDGKTIKVENEEAYAYIAECATGMRVKIVRNDDGTTKKVD